MTVSRLPFLAAAALFASGCATTGGLPSAGSGQPTVDGALCALGFSAIPMRALASGHHVVDVTLNGRPATFVVDTGAGATVINTAFAPDFALQAAQGAGPRSAFGLGGRTGVSQFAVNDLRVGGARTGATRIFATDLANVVTALEIATKTRVQGIVGQDVLRAQNGIVDVQQSRLYLKPVAGEAAVCG